MHEYGVNNNTKKRLGASKRRVLQSLLAKQNKGIYSTLLWEYNKQSNGIAANISKSTKSSFSRSIKDLENDGLIQTSFILIDEISDDEYLRIAIDKSSDSKIRKFRELILPRLFDKHLKLKRNKLNYNTISDLESFVLNKDLSLQIDDFSLFKNDFLDLTGTAEIVIKRQFSQAVQNAPKKEVQITDALVKIKSLLSTRYSIESNHPLYWYLKELQDTVNGFEVIYQDYKRILKNRYLNLYRRFERKNLYFHYCSSPPNGRQSSIYFKTTIGFTENFIKEHKDIIDKITISFDKYKLAREEEEGKKNSFFSLSYKRDYNEYIRTTYLDKLFDPNWCRSRTEKEMIEITNRGIEKILSTP